MEREKLVDILEKYFSIGDSYTYELNRVKEGFYYGTISTEDFLEWTNENVNDLADYILRKWEA